MFAATDTPHAPWTVINAECKKRARLNAMRYVLGQFDYPHKSENDVGPIDPLLVGRATSRVDPSAASRKTRPHRKPHRK